MQRFWDPNNEFIEGVLKEYSFWSLELAFRQHTLGSFVIFLKRECQKFSELTNDEHLELLTIIKEMESALDSNELFKPDKYNYLQLGNNVGFLHIWGIPRYKSEKTFEGVRFADENFGTTPPWTKERQSVEFIRKLKKAIIL